MLESINIWRIVSGTSDASWLNNNPAMAVTWGAAMLVPLKKTNSSARDLLLPHVL